MLQKEKLRAAAANGQQIFPARPKDHVSQFSGPAGFAFGQSGQSEKSFAVMLTQGPLHGVELSPPAVHQQQVRPWRAGSHPPGGEGGQRQIVVAAVLQLGKGVEAVGIFFFP